jgi:antitoxin VapB
MGGIRAKLFMNGGSQAVRLPKDMRFDGREVIVEKVDDTVVLRPLSQREAPKDEWAWLQELQRLADEAGPFMPEGREQPDMPPMKREVAEFFGVKDD